jgi:geranylgeranyl reductase family protein
MSRFDVVVVGAGPAGSSCAARLARAGANVLLLDKATFPRDKPCGGAVTRRAALAAECEIGPVVERIVTVADILDGGGRVQVCDASIPIAYMTQRRHLDQHLVEDARSAGAEFRDGVGRVVVDGEAMSVSVNGERCRASVIVGADGANGVTAQALKLGQLRATGIALEANLPRSAADVSRYLGRGVVQFGIVRGGYGWIFPKGDHVNVGVGGWLSEAPDLRLRLHDFCERRGLPFDRLYGIRGHRLPMKTPHAALARGRACLVGDAAGLVDPLTGDGMYECFVSARLAAENVIALLHGRASSLVAYQQALDRRLRSHHWASWLLKLAFDRFPQTTYRLATSRPVWTVIRDLLTGELPDFESATGRRYPLRLLGALAG